MRMPERLKWGQMVNDTHPTVTAMVLSHAWCVSSHLEYKVSSQSTCHKYVYTVRTSILHTMTQLTCISDDSTIITVLCCAQYHACHFYVHIPNSDMTFFQEHTCTIGDTLCLPQCLTSRRCNMCTNKLAAKPAPRHTHMPHLQPVHKQSCSIYTNSRWTRHAYLMRGHSMVFMFVTSTTLGAKS